jgi:hypothetical protein
VKELYEALRCPKDYVLFTAEEGVRAFCRDGRQAARVPCLLEPRH